MERLSAILSNQELTEQLEDIIGDPNLLIDTGFYIEGYVHPDGIGSLRGEGKRAVYYIDKPISYRKFLDMQKGSVRQGTLTLRVIPINEPFFEIERKSAIPLSQLFMRINQ